MSTQWNQYKAEAEHARKFGNLPEAEVMWQKALKEAEQFGKKDARYALTLDKLGEIYFEQKKYAQAEELFVHSLTIRESVNFNNPDTATTLMHLYTLYYTQGKYDKAEPMCRRVMAMYEKALGEE